jgi:cellulose biosynthesis protein BcsQ
MNVITLASRKGGVGKSTLTAHLAAFAHLMGHRCMVIDADPQGSLDLTTVSGGPATEAPPRRENFGELAKRSGANLIILPQCGKHG